MSERDAAKAHLRQALADYAGNTTQAEVAKAIAHLATLNPTLTPARQDSLRDGHWLLISAPNFPNGERLEDGRYQYTLGRLAFTMFQPTALKVVLDRVWQPVLPIPGKAQHTHDIVVEFTTVDATSPSLRGIVRNLGICEPISNTLLQVQFTGGSMVPHPEQPLDDWKATFADQSSSPKTLKDRFLTLFLKLTFGIVPPTGMSPDTGEIAFQMRRSPKGKLEILYLDEELRITRGEKGTVLVCERSTSSP